MRILNIWQQWECFLEERTPPRNITCAEFSSLKNNSLGWIQTKQFFVRISIVLLPLICFILLMLCLLPVSAEYAFSGVPLRECTQHDHDSRPPEARSWGKNTLKFITPSQSPSRLFLGWSRDMYFRRRVRGEGRVTYNARYFDLYASN